MSRPAFPHDATMPGMSLAVDPSKMKAMFAAELLKRNGTAYTIDECRLLRIRYRPAEHCFVHYELDLHSTKSAQRTTAWLTGIIYPDERPRRRLKKLLAACEGEPTSASWHAFGPAFYLSAPHMLVQTFPCDRRLPGLPSIVSGAAADLEPALTRAFGPGDWEPTLCSIQPARYRALSGAVLRFSIEATERKTGERNTKTPYIKISRNGEGKSEACLLEALHSQAEATNQPFTVTKPLAYVDSLSALIVEEAPGDCFEKAVLNGVGLQDAARRTARGLAALHQWTIAPPAATDAVIARAQVAAEYVGWACPTLADEAQAIVYAAEAALLSTPLAPTHLDLKPDHVFLDGERVVFIDLNTFGAADPVLDIATLLARLAAMPARFGAAPKNVETAARALAEEYFARVPKDWRLRLDINHAIASMQVASEFFRHQHPDWRDLVPAWIKKARHSAAAVPLGVAIQNRASQKG